MCNGNEISLKMFSKVQFNTLEAQTMLVRYGGPRIKISLVMKYSAMRLK